MNKTYTAGVLVFSGRPNPEWKLSEEKFTTILSLFDSLESITGSFQSESILGYSGCYVKSSDGALQFNVYNGKAELTFGANKRLKADKERTLEKEIIGTAPGGTIPKGVIDF
jgi:hypothetical protein